MDNSTDDMFPNTFSKKRKEKHTGLHAQKMHRTAPVKAAVSRGKTRNERETGFHCTVRISPLQK